MPQTVFLTIAGTIRVLMNESAEVKAQPSHRSALVTGCSSGIGLAITEHLLKHDWAVTGLSRTRPDLDNPKFRFLAVDLLDFEAADQVLTRVGAVDAVIHAAGLLRVGTCEAMNLGDGAMMWRLHVDTAARLIQHLVPAMPQGGRIMLIGSRVATGAAGKSLYAATKAALLGLARSVAAELAPRRITVNVIAPGATDTPMLRDPERVDVIPKLPPFGRFVQPEEVAALAMFLLSDAAANITGQQIVICGGASL